LSFVGVGFDGRGSFSSDSRKQDVIQRTCVGKATFKEDELPDNFHAFDILDYSVQTKSFLSADDYVEHLGEKAGCAKTKNMFFAEKKMRSSSWSDGGKLRHLAVMDVNLKLYGLSLGTLTPNDLSVAFINNFMKLPSDYYEVGANDKLESFLREYGTHFVNSAKFGGQLTVMKTCSGSEMTRDEFAAAAELEFSAMFATLQNSYEQIRSGSAHPTNSPLIPPMTERSQFIQTTFDIKGGDPQIAKAIMDFYSPNFRSDFSKWLDSVPHFPKPIDFTLQKLSSALDFSRDTFFTADDVEMGCFSTKPRPTSSDPLHCPYGSDKDKFFADFTAKRLSLESAERTFMAEGLRSTNSFQLPGGEAGCETETIDYIGISKSNTWPSWKEITSGPFKVVFRLPRDLSFIKAKSEFIIRLYDNMWFTKSPGESFTVDHTCPAVKNFSKNKIICVKGIQMKYDENYGFLELYEEGNKDSIKKTHHKRRGHRESPSRGGHRKQSC
jgi:hypothetical protein